MSNVIIMLLLAAFSICVTVGLLTVLQNLVNGDSTDDAHQGAAFPEAAEQ